MEQRSRWGRWWIVGIACAGMGPAVGAAAQDASVICTRHLEAVGRALAAYQRDVGSLPPHLSDLYPQYLKDEAPLHCPADLSPGTSGVGGGPQDPVPNSYLYEMTLDTRPGGALLGQ